MSKIRIKNFGPIKEGYKQNNEWIEIKKVTVFVGNQGSGKSTVAKVISTLTWLEKAINRGDLRKDDISLSDFESFFKYQRINNYFTKSTEIEYEGNAFHIKYNKNLRPPVIEISNYWGYEVPKIMYVPAERNFLTITKNPYIIKGLPETLETFAVELRKGQLQLNSETLPLPIGDVSYKYDKQTDNSFIIGDNYNVNVTESSSGYQSLIPLYLVTKFLIDELFDEDVQLGVDQRLRRSIEMDNVMFDESLTPEQKASKINQIKSKYINSCLINIVEEPELNLFPSSQWLLLKSLLGFNSLIKSNKLIMTTHSPYIINYLTLAVEADNLKKKIKTRELKEKLNDIVPDNATIKSSDLVIYELDETTGIIKQLGTYNGLPLDDNYLNQNLAHTNDLFSQLLDIEDLCR